MIPLICIQYIDEFPIFELRKELEARYLKLSSLSYHAIKM